MTAIDTSKWELRSDVHSEITFWEIVEPRPDDQGPRDPHRSIVCDFGVRPNCEAEARWVMACLRAMQGVQNPEAFMLAVRKAAFKKTWSEITERDLLDIRDQMETSTA